MPTDSFGSVGILFLKRYKMAKKKENEIKENTGSVASGFNDLDDIIAKEFESLVDISKVDMKVKLWYDWGIYALNYICSKNLFYGVPAGRITSLKGLSGTGKSLLLCQVTKDPKVDMVIGIGSEGGGLSPELFEFAGVDTSKVRLSQFNTFANYRVSKKNGKYEEVSDGEFPVKRDTDDWVYYEGATRFLKRLLNAIEFKGIKANIVILLDSLANFKSVRELNGGVDMGARAKDINTFFGVFDNAFERTNVAFLFANKVYTNLGNVYDPWKEAGGEGAIYNPSLSLFLKDMADTKDMSEAEMKEEKDRRKTALGSSLKVIKAIVDKSRFGTELRNINFLIDFSSGPIRLSGLYQLCDEFGIMEKSGNSYTIPGVIDKPFFRKEFIDVVAADEANIINKLQKRLEEAEASLKKAKEKLQVSGIVEEINSNNDEEYQDLLSQMAKDKED